MTVVKASLVARLRRSGHHLVLPRDVGLAGSWDPLHLLHAVKYGLLLISKNHDDFRDLHILIEATSGQHSGIAIVRADNDPRRDMNDRDITRALANLEAASVPIANELHILNHWR